MHSRTIIRGQPGLCGRIHKHPGHFYAAGPPARHASSFFPQSPFHYGPSRGPPRGPPMGDFLPLMRLMDDYSRDIFRGFDNTFHPAALARGEDFLNLGVARSQVFNPKFDVKETDNAYELRGELPGVDASNVEVAFTDNQTLVIKGRTEREVKQGNAPQGTTENTDAVAAASEQPEETAAADNASEAGSTFSTSSYQKPSVEDEDAAQQTPATTTAEATLQTEQAESSADAAARATNEKNDSTVAQQQQKPQSHYWVSERSIGTFQRTFNFPARVDHDGVKASLKNGILEMSVPKATGSEARKIEIQ